MTTHEFSNILKNPDQITLSQVYELENLVHEFPYFQAARAAHLRILYTQGSYRYNKALKITASHVGDRTILFDFITSPFFKEPQKPLFEPVKNMPKTYYDQAIPQEFTQYVTEDIFAPVEPKQLSSEKIPDAMSSIIGEFTPSSDKNRALEESLQMGKPLNFEQNDTHSFEKWLEITRYKPIIRTEKDKFEDEKTATSEKSVFEKDDTRAKKFDLIDKFLETNPKIEARKDYVSNIDLTNDSQANEHQLMTETLAKVYLEQGKYSEAIRAYQILILKNPEKSRFFADQIEAIRKLQQNNL